MSIMRELSSGLKRELARMAFFGSIIAAAIGAGATIVSAYIAILPRLPTQEHVYHIQVSANAFPFSSSNVTVEEGDEVWIIVEGEDAHWDCKTTDPVSADGYFADRRAGFYSPSANFGELVGHIQQNGTPFRIGTYEHFVAERSGLLYLGANDDPDPGSNNEYPYYNDNLGELNVRIIVRRQ